MNNDQALRNSLNRHGDELPYGFEQRIMRRIQQEEARKNRINYYRSLTLVSVVSVALVAGLYYVIDLFFGIDFIKTLQQITLNAPKISFDTLSPSSQSMLSFCIFVAVIILILLSLDQLLRSKFRKS